MAGTRTLLPGGKPKAVRARCSAAVPELTPTEVGTPMYWLQAFSNSPTSGPNPSQPRSNTERMPASSSSPIQGLNNLICILVRCLLFSGFLERSDKFIKERKDRVLCGDERS